MRLASALQLSLLLFLTPASPLSGQAPADASVLLAVADTLARADSTADRQRFDQTLQRIEQLLDRNDRSPLLWHALARLRTSMSLRGFAVKSTAYHPSGISYRRAAMDAYGRALKSDSAYIAPADELAQLIILLRARRLNQDFTAPLAISARQPGATRDSSRAEPAGLV